MLCLLKSFLVLLKTIEVYASLLCNKKVCRVRRVVDPVYGEDLFVVFLNGDGLFDCGEVDEESSFHGEEKKHIFLEIVGEVSDHIWFSKVDEFEVVFVYDVHNVPVVDDGDVAFEVEEVLAKLAEPLLDFLQFCVFLGINQFQQMLLALLHQLIIS
jgi:hypothetical protein